MVDDAGTEAAPPAARRRRRLWWPLRWLAGLLLGLVALGSVGLFVLDTDFGHRFLADRIAALSPSTGLRIRIGRIDGSLWRNTELRDVRLYDPQGLFLEIPQVKLRWRPLAWLDNRLDIDRVTTDLAILHHVPKLRPSAKPRPILPGFDIRIGTLQVETLRLDPAVAGAPRVGRLKAKADVRSGRALIDINAASNAGDRLRLLLDAEPDRDRFDLNARVSAPAGGVLGKVVGTERPIRFAVTGKGTWASWNGSARLDVSGLRIADLGLGVRGGAYSLGGVLAPAPLLSGKLHRLSSPRIVVNGKATLARRQLDTALSLRSGALTIDGKGVLDLAHSAFDGVTLDAHLLKPPALFPNMTGRNVRMRATLDGPFARAAFHYVLTADRAAFDETGFEVVHAEGRGHFSPSPVSVPVKLSAARVTGVGNVAGGILARLTLDGTLKVTSKLVTGEGMALTSDKIKGKLALLLDLRTGDYTVTLSGGMTRYLIPGLGLVDVLTELKVVPGPGGHGSIVAGRGHAWVRRFDNNFLHSLAVGLPEIETGLVRGTDGILLLRGLKLTAPGVSITGNGLRRRDGTFQFEGTGTQQDYGPFRMKLDGDISHPKLDFLLAHPVDALGLTDVTLALDPNPQGYAWTGRGGSYLGPFTGNGQLLLPAGVPATIGVAAIDVAGTRATGAVRSMTGGFMGRLGVAGGGLDGDLLFRPAGNVQEIAVKLAADSATLPGLIAASVRKGTLDTTIRLDPAGTTIKGSLLARGVRRGAVSLGRLAATANLAGGIGKARVSIAGSRGRAFELTADADIGRNRVALNGGGTIDRVPLKLTSPAIFTREGAEGGWRLARTGLSYDGGGATLGGYFGSDSMELEGGLERMPLTIADLVYPRLGLGGSASGTFRYRKPKGGLPTGRADLTVRGLTRSGLVLSSRPVDLGVAAVLDADRLVARAVAASDGKVIGRAQARLAPLGSAGDLETRLRNAPLFAQLRYSGPADTLWRLSGIETIDLSGPVAVGADVTGRLADPVIRGSLKAEGARLESSVSGTTITNLKASGRFGGSALVVDSFTGTAGEGTVSGRGRFDFAAAHGLGMDIQLNADNAEMLNRDDIGATVTGPLTIRSDGAGGTIAGDVTLRKSHYRLGRAAVATIPRVTHLTEVNRPPDEAEEVAPPVPWTLDLKAHARNRLAITGLGLDSEWRADLVIKGTTENPAITGRADLVRGDYEFSGRRFDLDRGAIRFLGQAPPDPVLDIVAVANIQGLNASIHVSGTGLHPEIDFQSTPALPEDELLSRLLFGTSITNLSAPEALQLAAAVASLREGGDGGLNPINAVRRVAGLDRLRILPADVTTGQKTAIAAGKYVGRRTYVEVISDGAGYSATRVEFQITRWLSLLGSISTIGRSSGNVRISKDY
ncbi:MAG TPA: translocation/assembly module TamB domain-containing protein [Sphingomonadaceae bacterium]|nr:translocation/assembly module TamB domain-containing protein [Sphingomonadaceae bacterium]